MKQIIKTPDAPNPVGPYNQAVLSKGILYVSGQIAIDPNTNKLIVSNIEKETHQVLTNIKAILLKANVTFEHIVKASIFIKDMNNFSAINQIYASYFNENTAPARECVEVTQLPKNVNVEISVIAHV